MFFSRNSAKKSRLPVLFIVAPFSVMATFAHAQVGDPPAGSNLFVAVDFPGWQDPLDSNGPAALRSRPVLVEYQLLDALDPEALPTPIVTFNPFDDISVAVVFDDAKPRWRSQVLEEPPVLIGYTWHGWIVGEDQGHVVMITEEPGICAANIHVAAVGSFQVRPLAMACTSSVNSIEARRGSAG